MKAWDGALDIDVPDKYFTDVCPTVAMPSKTWKSIRFRHPQTKQKS